MYNLLFLIKRKCQFPLVNSRFLTSLDYFLLFIIWMDHTNEHFQPSINTFFWFAIDTGKETRSRDLDCSFFYSNMYSKYWTNSSPPVSLQYSLNSSTFFFCKKESMCLFLPFVLVCDKNVKAYFFHHYNHQYNKPLERREQTIWWSYQRYLSEIKSNHRMQSSIVL